MTDFLLRQLTLAHGIAEASSAGGTPDQAVTDGFSLLAENDLSGLLDELNDLDEDHVRSLLDND
jgi:hypothetical protein